jgi:hypothetical protein
VWERFAFGFPGEASLEPVMMLIDEPLAVIPGPTDPRGPRKLVASLQRVVHFGVFRPICENAAFGSR